MINENDYLIQVKIMRDDGEIKLFVKSCEEFEKYLKKTRNISKSDNFCNTETTYKFYDKRLDGLSENAEYDSAIRELINYNRLNFAVLRIKGISDGVELKLNRLISIDDLNNMLRRFILDFKKFYKEYIKNFEIDCYISQKNILI